MLNPRFHPSFTNMRCHICFKDSESQLLRCTVCFKYFHISCLRLPYNEIEQLAGSREDGWVCGYCVGDVGSACCNVADAQSSRMDDGFNNSAASGACPQPLETNHFGVIMAKLNEISLVISEIKESQNTLSSELSECKSLLKEHSNDIRQHSTLLNTHCKTLEEHDSDISKCQAELALISQKNSTVELKLSALESKFDLLSSGSKTVPENSFPCSSSPREIIERVKRSHNILIRGVAEAECDDRVIAQLLDHVDSRANSQRISFSRIGRSNCSRPRPLRVTFSNSSIVSTILRRKNRIHDKPSWKNCTISDDKTPQQMEELAHLRVELKRRRLEGESNIDIKFVRGAPTIIEVPQRFAAKN